MLYFILMWQLSFRRVAFWPNALAPMRQTPFFLLLVSVTGFITDGDDVVDDDDDQHCLGSVRSGSCILRFVLLLLRLF